MILRTSTLAATLALCLVATAASAQVIYVPSGPPPPQEETPQAGDSSLGEWTPGYWFWNGMRHLWMPGRWQARPEAQCRYVQARWVPRGGRWMFMQGGWRCGRRMRFAPMPVFPNQPQVVQPQPMYPPQIVQPQPVFPQGVQQGVPAYHAPSGTVVQQPQTVYVRPAPHPTTVVMVPGRRGRPRFFHGR